MNRKSSEIFPCRNSFGGKKSTYVCDNTDNPVWQDQKFIVEVPEKNDDIFRMRNYKLRFNALNKSLFSLDTFIGRADVSLSCLASGKILEGWVPLRPRESSVRTQREFFQNRGAVRIRVQWIRDNRALEQFYDDVINRFDIVHFFTSMSFNSVNLDIV